MKKPQILRVMEFLDGNASGVIGWAFLEDKEYKKWLKYKQKGQMLKRINAYCSIDMLERDAEYGTVFNHRLQDYFHTIAEFALNAKDNTSYEQRFAIASDHPLKK